MRKLLGLTVIAAVSLLLGAHDKADASLIGAPRALRGTIEHIAFNTPTLAPLAFTRFCVAFADDCRTPRMIFRGGRLKLTAQRWRDLNVVNLRVNSSIVPERNLNGLAGEQWLVNPPSGDCNDYAVSKRHDLLARGWPARAVLLSEVITSWGEHHLIVVIRTRSGDLVLDNMTQRIVPWVNTDYRWVRIQTPANPKFWAKVEGRSAKPATET